MKRIIFNTISILYRGWIFCLRWWNKFDLFPSFVKGVFDTHYKSQTFDSHILYPNRFRITEEGPAFPAD